MSVECKNALRELCSILVTLKIYFSEDEAKQPSWLRAISRKYPGALVGSGKDVEVSDVKELQSKFNGLVGMKTFGYQCRLSEAYGDSIVIVIPKDVKEALKGKDPTGLLAQYADATDDEINFG